MHSPTIKTNTVYSQIHGNIVKTDKQLKAKIVTMVVLVNMILTEK
jgi:hypothetical protein